MKSENLNLMSAHVLKESLINILAVCFIFWFWNYNTTTESHPEQEILQSIKATHCDFVIMSK